jgi:hypothetical protein
VERSDAARPRKRGEDADGRPVRGSGIRNHAEREGKSWGSVVFEWGASYSRPHTLGVKPYALTFEPSTPNPNPAHWALSSEL